MFRCFNLLLLLFCLVYHSVNLTARVGEEVMFDDLPRDAESVKHLTNTGSIDVWRREQGVLTDRLTDSDGHLIIKNFRSSDAGTYRVLDSTGGVLVTVTLTEWGTESKDKQDSTRDDKTEDVCIGVLVLVALIAFTVFMIHRCLNRNNEQGTRNKGSQCKKLHRGPDHQTTAVVTWCLFFFLLFVLPGDSSLTVTGQKGGNITLPCNSSNKEDLYMVLTFGSKTAYGTGQSKYYEPLEHKTGNCDLILQDLKTTDAGKYNLQVYASGQLLDSYSYDICVNVNLTARVGEEVMFDDLPRDAESVECLTNTGSIDVWRREQGVLTDRLTDSDGHLIIKNFRSSDAGTYRVLNSTGGVLVTVTLTEWGTESKDKQDSTRDDKTKSTKRVYFCTWIVFGIVGTLTAFIVMRHPYRKRTKEHDSYLESPIC